MKTKSAATGGFNWEAQNNPNSTGFLIPWLSKRFLKFEFSITAVEYNQKLECSTNTGKFLMPINGRLCFQLKYFNYMGMLAVEGSYDKMEALLNQNIRPMDILLILAASEGDKPKIEELLRAGAKYDVEDADGKMAFDRAANDEIKDFILGFSAQKA